MYQVPVGSTRNPDRSCPLSGLTSEHVGSQLHWTAGALRVTLKIQAPGLPYFIQTVSILNAETALEDNKEPSSWLMYHENALSRLCCSEGPVPKICIESPPSQRTHTSRCQTRSIAGSPIAVREQVQERVPLLTALVTLGALICLRAIAEFT